MGNTALIGFKAAGMVAGIKKNGQPDLGAIFSTQPAAVAAVFTRNKVQAAPVLLDKERVKSGICQVIIANSGNANCCTGQQGVDDAKNMTGMAAKQLKIDTQSVLVASTGVIGQALPIAQIQAAMPQLVQKLSQDGFDDFATAIMTTDTVPKLVTKSGEIDGNNYTITGISKGSGMIHPDMATMLAFVCTDADVPVKMLSAVLKKSVDRSFNCITVDGDTSTNDTAIIMANGLSGAKVINEAHQDQFQQVLDDVLMQLARMMIKDAEGGTKLSEIIVQGAKTVADARKVAETIAGSSLVKTALFGQDANWGRILAAAGRAGVDMDPDTVDIYFDDVLLVKKSVWCGDAAEAAATAVLKNSEMVITVDLHLGEGQANMLTSDLTIDYIKINADYRS
jgi:glutamate N-acetyltransferase / amino-acid N-acetyltransferase